MPLVWQVSAVECSERKVLLEGVILHSSPYQHDSHTSAFRNLRNVVRSYRTKVFKNSAILLSDGNQRVTTKTNHYGYFRNVITGFDGKKLKIFLPDSDEPLEMVQNYPKFFRDTESSYDIISDIDDTLIESHTSSSLKRVGTLALRPPLKRRVVPFTKGILEKIVDDNVGVYYVSKSESNLFGIINTIITRNDLPNGPLFLTPYIGFRELIFSQKEPDFKRDHIHFLLKESPKKNFILFGDDTQRDLEIYAEIAETFPDRISKLFIRKTRSGISADNQRHIDRLVDSPVAIQLYEPDQPISESDLPEIARK